MYKLVVDRDTWPKTAFPQAYLANTRVTPKVGMTFTIKGEKWVVRKVIAKHKMALITYS